MSGYLILTEDMRVGHRICELRHFGRHLRGPVLITTDFMARVDIDTVHLVINYDMPKSQIELLHRNGRAGRFGNRGFCFKYVYVTH